MDSVSAPKGLNDGTVDREDTFSLENTHRSSPEGNGVNGESRSAEGHAKHTPVPLYPPEARGAPTVLLMCELCPEMGASWEGWLERVQKLTIFSLPGRQV